MKKTWIATLLLGATGCAALTPRASRAPLENEGEVLVYLQPLGSEADRLSFTLGAISAVRSDGVAVALELVLTDLPGRDAGQQRLLASGRLPPGRYRALDVIVTRATMASQDGPARLLVGKEPTTVPASFDVHAGRAAVLTARFRPETSVQTGYAFAPQFTIGAPARSMPQLTGACSNTDSNDVTLFDKRGHQVFSVLATGRAPQGVVIAPIVNRMYVAVSGDDEVEVFDLTTSEPLPRIRLVPGDRPRELALSPDGRTLIVLNQGSNSLAFVDVNAGSEIARAATGVSPISLLVDRSWRRAYVLNEGSNSITAIDLSSRNVVGTVPTDFGPLRAQLNRAGNRLYVVYSGSPQMNVFSVPDLANVGHVMVGLGSSTLKIDPRTDMIYVAKRDERRIYVYDSFSLIPIDFFDVPGGVGWLAIDDTENTLLATLPSAKAVAVFDLPGRRQLASVPVGEGPYQVSVAEERL